MTAEFQIRIYRNHELSYTGILTKRLEIGRQRPGEPEPYELLRDSNRIIIAPLDEKLVSREHLELSIAEEESEGSEQIAIRNLSKKRSVHLKSFGKLAPQQDVTLSSPLMISFEDFAIRVESVLESAWLTKTLMQPTLAPTLTSDSTPAPQLSMMAQQSFLHATEDDHSTEQLIHWLSQMMGVLQSAASSSDFLAESVKAVNAILGLDQIDALTYENDNWQVEYSESSSSSVRLSSDSKFPSRTILNEVLDKKSTIYQVPSTAAGSASLLGIKALVASPILNPSGECIGALYGARFSNATNPVPQISELEATMVEVLACSAAAGIARQKQQEQALEAKFRFEQFFTPELARELESNPSMLEGTDSEISVMFCDIAGFSSISNRVGPRITMQWISDIMDRLSGVVLDHEGVVVDYIGDELMAMWGAPKAQPDHARRACSAARSFLECKAEMDRKWLSEVGQAIDFRVGICSGVASVGNVGTTKRLKYGPVGNTVNLASRLQSAAKQFGVKQLISHDTASAIEHSPKLALRPLGTATFVNIPNPRPIYELGSADDLEFQAISKGFKKVLYSIEAGAMAEARKELHSLLKLTPHDQATQMLLKKITSEKLDRNCLWPLDQK
ncbi:MAG: adenylate/guanylate cyclase domain-containing protein [Planctomycetota bacterium]